MKEVLLGRPGVGTKVRPDKLAQALGTGGTLCEVEALQGFRHPDVDGERFLKPVGKYGAAQATFHDAGEIDPRVIRRWLKLAKSKVFDSKAFFKKLREGK
jgi:hypothetical protein